MSNSERGLYILVKGAKIQIKKIKGIMNQDRDPNIYNVLNLKKNMKIWKSYGIAFLAFPVLLLYLYVLVIHFNFLNG